jgi:hypothetical protein
MKREFPFDTALKALEVTWSSLPPATADTKVLSPVIVLFLPVLWIRIRIQWGPWIRIRIANPDLYPGGQK